MSEIRLLSQETIDLIAAGEVVERPASVVKELVENAIDAGSTAISVEIKEGGIGYIRITDNGIGIEKDQVQRAFLRHSTSKISSADDLISVKSLGFRGEALSSIAAVAMVELITKPASQLLGSRYVIEGALEKNFEDIGCPNGTTFIVRQLFYNTPARKKFLKAESTEGSYCYDVVENLALSHPEISFRFIAGGKDRLITSGNGNLMDNVYQIFGRQIANNLLEIKYQDDDIEVEGYIGNSVLARGNRSFEHFFINGRYVKSNNLSKAVEEGYYGFLMGHQFPFFILSIRFNDGNVDVNVHPTKQEVRINDESKVLTQLTKIISERLRRREDVIEAEVETKQEANKPIVVEEQSLRKVPEPFEAKKLAAIKESITQQIRKDTPYEKKYERPIAKVEEEQTGKTLFTDKVTAEKVYEQSPVFEQTTFLTPEATKEHKIIGQVFDTYWIIEYDGKMYIIDQHAAHEKVLFEQTMERIRNNTITSQMISPAIIISLSNSDKLALDNYREAFENVGFSFSDFGGNEIAIDAVPGNMVDINLKEMFLEMLADCGTYKASESLDMIVERVATMSCKAAVKGNNKLSLDEIKVLIDQLLTLENPYHCPHGRPTMIAFTEYELAKKFKRIV